MESLRTQRANSEIERALAEILSTKINDPRLKQMITITNVQVSPDFRHCKVFVSVLSENANEIVNLLKKSQGFIKHELISMIELPFAPELVFILDTGASHSENINRILETLDIPKQTGDDETTD